MLVLAQFLDDRRNYCFGAKARYSKRPKSGRPDFGVFKKRLVVNPSGFQELSEIQT